MQEVGGWRAVGGERVDRLASVVAAAAAVVGKGEEFR